jgi:hypothetical protein
MLGKELREQKKKEKDELKKVHKPTLQESVVARRNENYPIEAIRIICSHCEAVLNTEEKESIIYKLERGVSCKVICKKCVQKFNKKYFEKNAEKLKAQRESLRDVVAQDKLNHVCGCEVRCSVRGKVIFHRKRNREVSIATVTLKDYNENCQIVCSKKISIEILGDAKKEPVRFIPSNQFDKLIDKITSIDYKVLFESLEDFFFETNDWMFANSDQGVKSFSIHFFENTDSIYRNNIEILLVTDNKKVIYSSLSFGDIYQDATPDIDNKQFEIRYCLDKFITDVNYDNLLKHYKTYKTPEHFLGDNGEDVRLELMQPLTIDTYEKLR